jgi:hypothetical protein
MLLAVGFSPIDLVHAGSGATGTGENASEQAKILINQ